MRNYDRPDPAKVVSNIARVLKAQDMTLLSHDAYRFLITHCGFIAHYDQGGFIATYKDDLPAFIEAFLSQLGMGWDLHLDNPRSYLYDVSYKGKVLAEIIQELIPLFTNAREPVRIAHDAKVRSAKRHRLEALAHELGYKLVKS